MLKKISDYYVKPQKISESDQVIGLENRRRTTMSQNLLGPLTLIARFKALKETC